MTDGYAIGVDFGGTKMLGAMVDADGHIVGEQRFPTPYDGEELLDTIAQLVGVLETQTGVQAVGVGVGAAGCVDRAGVLVYGPNVGRLEGLHIKEGLDHRLDGRIIKVENDNTCAMWAEVLLGAGRGGSDVLFVGLGTGIGAGIVSGGQIVLGRNGFAAEVGHMTVDVGGYACVCGKNGCWEAYASGRALGHLGREAAAAGHAHRLLELAGAVDDIRGEHVTRAARESDPGALAIMDEFARWLAVGLDNLVTILDPEMVVVGGGMSGESDLYFAKTREYLRKTMYAVNHRPEVPFVVAELGARAGVIGAAMLVHSDQLERLRR